MAAAAPAASTLRCRGRVTVQALDLPATPRPLQPPYMSCRESTRALHEPPAATFLDVTVMTGIYPGPGEAFC